MAQLADLLHSSAVRLDIPVHDWREAIRLVGEVLLVKVEGLRERDHLRGHGCGDSSVSQFGVLVIYDLHRMLASPHMQCASALREHFAGSQ